MNNTDSVVLPIRASLHWALKILYAVGVIFFSSLVIATWLNFHSLFMSFLFGLFAILSIYVFLSAFTTIQVDEKSIIITAPLGIYKIDWAEIVAIEKTVTDDWRFESNDITFAFMGENKCLPLNLRLAGNRKDDLYRFVQTQIAQLQIKVIPLSSKWLRPQNTRVRRFGFW